MAYEQVRKVIRVGPRSSAVVLPKPWVNYLGERARQLTLLGDAVIILAPQGYKAKARHILHLLETEKSRERLPGKRHEPKSQTGAPCHAEGC